MVYEISEVKMIRKKLGITQGELASRAGVSQSMIAKVEAGILDPTYSNANKIFNALDSYKDKEALKIDKVMVKKIISVSPADEIRKVIQKMKHYEISQMPVIDKNMPVGLISEGDLLDALMTGKDPSDPVKSVMGDTPPTVSVLADIEVATHLLKHYPLIFVIDKGKPVGIVTKADLLRSVFRK